MGSFKDRLQKKIETDGFTPMELTEDTVNTIYNRCLPKDDTPKEDIVQHWIFLEKNGFSENSNPFLLLQIGIR